MLSSIIPSHDALASIGIIGGGFSFDGLLTIEPPVQIAHDVVLYEANHIGQFSYICAGGRILQATIGRYCSIAEHVALGIREHPTDRVSTHPFTYNESFWEFAAYQHIVGQDNLLPNSEVARTEIGHDVWIGRMATVKSGVKIGHGAVVGAHAVVTHDVAPYDIVAGVPARMIRKRFNDKTIADLLALGWWDYDVALVRDKAGYCDVDRFIDVLSRMRDKGEVQRLYPVRHKLLNEDGVLRTLPYEG